MTKHMNVNPRATVKKTRLKEGHEHELQSLIAHLGKESFPVSTRVMETLDEEGTELLQQDPETRHLEAATATCCQVSWSNMSIDIFNVIGINASFILTNQRHIICMYPPHKEPKNEKILRVQRTQPLAKHCMNTRKKIHTTSEVHSTQVPVYSTCFFQVFILRIPDNTN